MSRTQLLKERGYQEPFDESPIPTPEGWVGGGVRNTGGNIFCRIWRTWEEGERDQNTEYEIIYNTDDGPLVGLQAYTWDQESDGYTFDHKVRSKKTTETDDLAQAKLARELMLEHEN